MARARTKTHDYAEPEPLSEVTMDGFLSSSWPAAAPPRNRPEPPRAPLRKPSDVNWEVPEYHLPVAPKKRSLSADCSGTTEESPPTPADEAEKSEDEDDDAGMFALDGGAAEDDDDFELGDAFQLAGFDDGDDDDIGPLISERKFSYTAGYPSQMGQERTDYSMMSQSLPAQPVCRLRCDSQKVELGASPILLSVLEQVAAAQAVQRPGGRSRADSC